MDSPSAVTAIADKQLAKDNLFTLEDTIRFYTDHYQFVQLVTCDACGADLCLWVLIPERVRQNVQMHHDGLTRIELDEALMQTRPRHDGVMGYQCSCGADTLLSEIEIGIVPTSRSPIPATQPHIEALVKKQMLATNYKPKVEMINGHEVVEGFIHRRLK
jgi:hypothetical protein